MNYSSRTYDGSTSTLGAGGGGGGRGAGGGLFKNEMLNK